MAKGLYEIDRLGGRDYLLNVARGRVEGAYPFVAYGEKTTVGADSGVLWPNGVFIFPPSVGTQISIVSSSAQDSPAGVGARAIDVHYLDSNLTEHVISISLAGLTSVLTPVSDIRFIQCMHLTSWGSSMKAVGDIIASSGLGTHSQISAGGVRCSSSVRMVPAGKRLMVSDFFAGAVSGTAASKVIVRLATPSFDGHDFTQSNFFLPLASGGFQDTSSGISTTCPFGLTAGQSIGLTFECDKAATISGSWFGWMEPE